jgi:hypothetical protein
VTELGTYTVETLWEDEEFVLSRRVSNDEPVSFLVSTPASAQPTVETVARRTPMRFGTSWIPRGSSTRGAGTSRWKVCALDGGLGRRSTRANGREALGSDAVPARRDQDNSPFGANIPHGGET